MWSGYCGLAAGFVVIVSLILIVFIKSDIKIYKKLAIIPIAIWFSAVMYWIPQSLMGWAKVGYPPDGSIILEYRINEPQGPDKGNIYLWVLPKQKLEEVGILDPKRIFEFAYSRKSPRSFEIPYSLPKHKEMQRAEKQKQRVKGFMIFQREDNDKSFVKIINPETILRKYENEENIN